MPTISVLPDRGDAFRAFAGDEQAVGPTAGQALDRLAARLGTSAEATLVVIQPQMPDAFFPADRQAALDGLMTRWRAARDAGRTLPPADQAALDDLVREEVAAAGRRAAALLAGLPS